MCILRAELEKCRGSVCHVCNIKLKTNYILLHLFTTLHCIFMHVIMLSYKKKLGR